MPGSGDHRAPGDGGKLTGGAATILAAVVVLVLVGALLGGCGESTEDAGRITGTISIRNRPPPLLADADSGIGETSETFELPEDSTITLRLLDVTESQMPPTIVSEATYAPDQLRQPIAFELPYNPAWIDPDRSYAVEAELAGTHMLTAESFPWRFATDTPVPVLTASNRSTGLMLTLRPAINGIAGLADWSISGTLTTDGDKTPPPEARVSVQLIDLSYTDRPGTVLAAQSFTFGQSQAAIPFELSFDPYRIRAGGWYAIEAAIEEPGGHTLYETSPPSLVLTHGQPANDLKVTLQPPGS